MIVFAIVLATVVSFVASAALYVLPPVARLIARTSTARPGVPMWAQLASVVLRSAVTAVLVTGLMIAAGWHGAGEGLLLGLALATLPAVLLFGAVVHENTPIPTAAVHLSDWTMKLVVVGAIVGAFV